MNFARLCTLTIILLGSSQLQAQVLTEWVESRAAQETDKIALGYPVPIPVNTPLPFDGFRTYAGLHMRHQDLMTSTAWVHQEPVGLTRSGRTIWAYRLGDDDMLTIDGLPEPAMLTNGGIHAREWQTPEVVTGILELMALHEQDHHFYDYLRDNVNMIVIPSLNIDGFMQTQRYPRFSYMQSDPDDPSYSPRDGRMRRKNMLSADEDFYTTTDHLNGVDLNRNSNPFWASSPGRSSPGLQSIVHHGAAPASEPEIQALDAAAQLGPIERLRLYTDVHSFSMVHYWVRNDNIRLAQQTSSVLSTFSQHHLQFPAAKNYYFARSNTTGRNQGIGTTDEYFTFTYQVPSWTLEVEPSGGQTYHAPLPGAGADYGGLSENGHDGFILPESQIRRVREELAQSFAAVYYRQAGPPAVRSLRIFDAATGAVVVVAEWDVTDAQSRSLYFRQLQPLQINRSYDIWTAFNKPMRWREDDEVVPFPGKITFNLAYDFSTLVGDSTLTHIEESTAWLNQPGGAPDGYMHYQDDAYKLRMSLPEDTNNLGLVNGQVEAKLKFRTSDMTAMRTDANPATVADWSDGSWLNYENESGVQTDSGGYDMNITYQLTNQAVAPPFLLEAGMTSSWFDRSHDGEGFLLEMLADNVAVLYWFTYDSNGAQDWYVMVGEVLANRIEFPNIYHVTGGEFGPGFDPDKITEEVVGSASFLFSSCDQGDMSYQIGLQHGRMQLSRITRLMGLDCGNPQLPPISEEALLSGSWADPTHDGEGYNIEVLVNGQVVIYWFSYNPEGQRRWFFGVGEIVNGKLVFDNMQTTSGGIFGPDFDPQTVQFAPWGSLEMDLDCSGGTATYNSTEAGFGSGTLNVRRLTSIDQLNCPQ
jgi:hypothetical protein